MHPDRHQFPLFSLLPKWSPLREEEPLFLDLLELVLFSYWFLLYKLLVILCHEKTLNLFDCFQYNRNNDQQPSSTNGKRRDICSFGKKRWQDGNGSQEYGSRKGNTGYDITNERCRWFPGTNPWNESPTLLELFG